jgi:hypothetical protein
MKAHLDESSVRFDCFSKSLRRFHGFLPETKAIQLVYDLRQPKSSKGKTMTMLPAHEFLATFQPAK